MTNERTIFEEATVNIEYANIYITADMIGIP